ncbi:MAG TPA: NAD-dependent epimerase/dehydratase family protein [Symbiobacteriaceae bacterium]|nr:NAD-dependent epimerase/dehydratase family protein [Symbiobacteriaceae bacterium]
MKILLIGGTIFLGRHLAEAALARNHEVTLFTRGKHGPELFPGVEKIHGDRDGGLAALDGRRWDAVIDTCGYVPRIVSASARFLADKADHYTFVSTCSVYDLATPDPDENAPVLTMPDETVEQVTGETYGPLKALCEQAAEAAMPGRVLTVRPGLIVGPHDPSDRFTYWPWRMARGGEVLAPGRKDRAVQFIDARDLAQWTLHLVEARQTGVFNATGPDRSLTMAEVLETIQSTAGTAATLTWIPDQWLQAQKVGPWMELPLWVPDGEAAGLFSTNIGKAVAAGLTFRPLADTVRDTLAWDRARPADAERRAGLKSEREAELLAAWHRLS